MGLNPLRFPPPLLLHVFTSSFAPPLPFDLEAMEGANMFYGKCGCNQGYDKPVGAVPFLDVSSCHIGFYVSSNKKSRQNSKYLFKKDLYVSSDMLMFPPAR
jgi:hypothetical protein